MKMTRNLFAAAAFVLASGLAFAANPSAQAIADGAEVTDVQNGGMMNFVGPVNVTHEKAIGSKVTFALTEGQKRSIHVSRGDRVIAVPVRIAMPARKDRKQPQKSG